MKTCTTCKIEKPHDEFVAKGHKSRSSKCSKCLRDDITRIKDRQERRRRFRLLAEKKYKARNPEKHNAHTAVYTARKAGRLRKEPCEVCGDPKSEAHHDDYSKPLEVRWLCPKHHGEVHRKGAA